MKRLCLLLTVCSPFAFSQDKPAAAPASDAAKARVYVTDSDSWQMQSAGGGSFSGFGGASSGGARPQTAEVIKTVGERCKDLIVNNRPDASDYVIRLEHEGGKGLLAHKDKVAVFVRKSGDSIYSKSTLSVGGSVQGACEAIIKHWAVNAAAIAAMPAPTSPNATTVNVVAPAAAGPTMASLIVDANVSGADIEVDGEFMGNAPSTLAVTPGKHTIVVKKKGYADWTRTMTVSGSGVHLSAELDKS